MVHINVGCQVCLINFNNVDKLKKHLFSQQHRQKMVEVFKSDVSSGHGFFPHITLIDSLAKKDHKHPIVGLSMLTLCFSRESRTYFYLCHVCEEQCQPDKILSHLCHGDHCSNFGSYTDPNVLSFSWVPTMNMRDILRSRLIEDFEVNGQGTLQVLELPENLMKQLKTSRYFEVMHTLRENCKLNKLIEDVKPKRTMIQTYQRDSNRKHSLLGMPHLVECICDGSTEKRYYLCTLCKLTLATHMIIKHVLSFDHIFAYFDVWHPSTLLPKECYTDYKSFLPRILDFSKQTEEIYVTANMEIKQVILDPAEYASVNFSCYAEALKKLESKANEKKGSSLIVNVKQGDKLERRTEHAGVSATYTVVLRCQLCCDRFETISQYFKHLSKWGHKEMFMKSFSQAERDGVYEQTGRKPYVGLYTYLQQSSRQNKPVFGISLIVTCISTREEVIYVCFACKESFDESILKEHLESKKHLIDTLFYLNPLRFPFAWQNHLDLDDLKSAAWEEEKKRGPNQAVMMRVLHIPPRVLWNLFPPTYIKVMKHLAHHTNLKDSVPKRETCLRHKLNENIPVLGREFLVLYDVVQDDYTKVAILCLLCRRTLSNLERAAHVHSREHVEKFLNCFHPGSLTSHTDAETLLDLAKQAAHIHPTLPVQRIKLDKPIWEPCMYYTAINILTSAKRRHEQKPLISTIIPKRKLVPRKTVKEMDKDNSQKNSTNQPAASSITLMEESETKASEKSTDNSDLILETYAVKTAPEIANIQCIKTEEHGNEGANIDTLTLSEKESEIKKLHSEITSEDIKNTGSETGQLIKEEKTEEPATRKPSGELPETCQKTEKDDGAETVKEKIKSSKEGGKKRQNSMSEKSQENSFPDEDVGGKMESKRQPLTAKEETSCKEPQNMPSSGVKQEITADKGANGKPCDEAAKDKSPSQMNHQSTDQLWHYIKKKSREPVIGLSALYECICDPHDTIFLCECCSLMIPDDNIINHVAGFHHWKMYLGGLQTIPPQPQTEEIRNLAESFESLNGYGEAQVVDLDEAIYNKILKQDFKSALQAVKSYQAQQESRSELPSTSSPFGAEPVGTSVALQAQQEAQYMNENVQVVGMEIDSYSEDPESQPSSVAAQMFPTIKTNEVYSESNNVAMNKTEVPQSALIVNACLTVSRSDENASKSKDDIGPNTAVEPLETEIFKLLGTSQTFTNSSDTAATAKVIAAKRASSKTITSVAPSKSRDTTDVVCTTMTSSRATAKSNCTTAATKFSKTDYKTTVTISSSSATSAKPTAAKFSCSTTTTSAVPISSSTTSITKRRETTNKCTITTSSNTTAKSNCTTITTKSTAAPSSVTVAKLNSSITTTSTAPISSSTTSAAKHRKTTASTVSSQTMAIVAAAKMAKTHTNVASHVHMSNPTAMPHLTTAMFDGSEHKNPPTEPSHTSMTKTRPNYSSPTVGKNQLILVSCEGKQQVYCQLCLVRLKHSRHTSSDEHKINYEKMKDEKDVASRKLQKIEVKHDVYKELAALSAYEAIAKLKAMIQQRAVWEISSPTTEALKQTSASPYEASSPDDVTGKQEHLRPGHQSTAQVLSSISIGASTTGCSNLSIFLAVKNLDTKPIIGLGSVWECQGICQESFYLCASCKEMLLVTEICQHMVSSDHQKRCMMTHYAEFLYFMEDDNVPQEEKQNIQMEIAQMFSAQERSMRMDAQVVTLTHKLYESVRSAPFSQALEMVQNIKKEQKLRVSCQPLNIPHQTYKQPDNQHSLKELLQMKTLKHQTDHQSEKEARQKAEKHHWEDGLNGVKRRKVSSPVGVNSVPSETYLTKTHRSISMQAELRPTDSQHQRPVSELQVKQAEVHSESPSFSTDNPKSKQNMSGSPRDKYLQSRKRSAPASFETHYTSNPKHKDPRQGKYAHSSLQPVAQSSPGSVQESTSVNPAVSPTLLGPNDKATAARYDEQKALLLIDLVKETKFMSKLSAPDSAEIPSANNSSQGNVEQRLDSECVQTEIKMEKNKTKCYSGCLQVDDTPPSTKSVLSANNSSLENLLTTSNPSVKATETRLASASTADPCDLQHQSSVCDQNRFGNANQLRPSSVHSTATNPNTGLTPQPQGNTETHNAGVSQMPISSIITIRPNLVKKQFLGDYTEQDHNKVNTVIMISPSVSTVNTTSLNNTVAATGYDQYSQIAYVGTGLSGYCSPQAVVHNARPPPVSTESLYHSAGYTRGFFFPSQIYPEQEGICLQSFRHNLIIPSACVNLQMHHQQQQCSSWTGTTLATDDGKVINDAPYTYASISTVANNPQQF